MDFEELFQRRMRDLSMSRILRGAIWGAAAGSPLLFAATAGYVWGAPWSPWPFWAIPVLCSALFAGWVFVHPWSRGEVALLLDAALGTKETVVSAVSAEGRGEAFAWVREQAASVLRHAPKVRAKLTSRGQLVLLFSLLASCGLLFVPSRPKEPVPHAVGSSTARPAEGESMSKVERESREEAADRLKTSRITREAGEAFRKGDDPKFERAMEALGNDSDPKVRSEAQKKLAEAKREAEKRGGGDSARALAEAEEKLRVRDGRTERLSEMASAVTDQAPTRAAEAWRKDKSDAQATELEKALSESSSKPSPERKREATGKESGGRKGEEKGGTREAKGEAEKYGADSGGGGAKKSTSEGARFQAKTEITVVRASSSGGKTISLGGRTAQTPREAATRARTSTGGKEAVNPEGALHGEIPNAYNEQVRRYFNPRPVHP